MSEYTISYSKTSKPGILEDGHPTYINVTRQKPNYIALEKTVELLNEKEEKIDLLTKENKKLEWYYEELRTHVPEETLKLIDNLWNKIDGGKNMTHEKKYKWDVKKKAGWSTWESYPE